MRFFFTFLVFLVCCEQQGLHAQCAPGERHIRIEIEPDAYYDEVSFTLGTETAPVIYSGHLNADSLHIFEFCMPDSQCTVFAIKDVYGDGVFPDGYYKVYSNDSLIRQNLSGNYGFGETVKFGCPPGFSCDNPYLIDTLGIYQNPSPFETWYIYTPKDTGTYVISTCNLGNNCPTRIWVYDHCQGLIASENQTGAIFYSESGCANGAMATLYLGGGKTYYIRMKYTFGVCDSTPIRFSIQYAGPVVGCTDPSACNYNPLATISDTCIYYGNPDCKNNPDLVVLEDEIRNTFHLDFIANADACMVSEGCLRGTGNRYIVRFSTHIENNGQQDYFIGETPASQDSLSAQFVWDPCHNHWHYRGYAEYLLFDNSGNIVPIGTKNGFCVLDLECNHGGTGQFNCQNMGITAGCGDIYDASLPCQWIDITELQPGVYTLVVRVNWDRSPDKLGRTESSYENNWGQACFQLSYENNLPKVDLIDTGCPPVVDCKGVPLGNTRLDCEGVCGGTALRGDLNKDTVRNTSDLDAYLNAVLDKDVTASNCNDLYADGNLDVYDAALLQECTRYENDPFHWGLRFPCSFPTGIQNEKEIVYILPGALNEAAKTFDVTMVNPYSKVLGYEFSVTGLQIDSIENLDPVFDGEIRFNQAGKILALSATEKVIKKNILPGNLLRIHYAGTPGHKVCVDSVYAVVNDKYQRGLGYISTQNCVTSSTVSTQNLPDQVFGLFIQPNPFLESTQVFFPNPDAQAYTVTMSDVTGRVLRYLPNIRTESVTLVRNNLPAGTYFITVSGPLGTQVGRVIIP